jgi:anti-sigma factor ChrR (cupin superfamily)
MLNSDQTMRVVVDTSNIDWEPSPSAKVWRRKLERQGEEDARATSVVRYERGAKFSQHFHPLGEEFFVLEGTFADESGEYPAGTYVRNPSGSSHSPYSTEGCTIFVKLRQMDPQDRQRVVINTSEAHWYPGSIPGLTVMPLGQFGTEHTALVCWKPQTMFLRHRHFGGEEIFVLNGVFEDEHGAYPPGTWLRNPHLSEHTPFSRQGCTILVKTGHLAGRLA